jgi:hypothetical protein
LGEVPEHTAAANQLVIPFDNFEQFQNRKAAGNADARDSLTAGKINFGFLHVETAENGLPAMSRKAQGGSSPKRR